MSSFMADKVAFNTIERNKKAKILSTLVESNGFKSQAIRKSM